jgi:hypothetical protein
MKTLKLNTVILIMLVLNLRSQTETVTETTTTPVKNKNFEIGMNMYTLGFSNRYYSGLFNASVYYGYSERYIFSHYFANGIYFKYFKNNNAIRASINYFQKISSYDRAGLIYEDYYSPYYAPYNFSSTKAGELKIGYQRILGKRKLAPYFFADLRYMYSQTEGYNYYNYYPCATCMFAPQVTYQYLIEQSYLGVNKGLGLRLTLSRMITFNLETSFEFFISSSQNIKNSGGRINTGGFTLNPLQFSMGLTF